MEKSPESLRDNIIDKILKTDITIEELPKKLQKEINDLYIFVNYFYTSNEDEEIEFEKRIILKNDRSYYEECLRFALFDKLEMDDRFPKCVVEAFEKFKKNFIYTSYDSLDSSRKKSWLINFIKHKQKWRRRTIKSIEAQRIKNLKIKEYEDRKLKQKEISNKLELASKVTLLVNIDGEDENIEVNGYELVKLLKNL